MTQRRGRAASKGVVLGTGTDSGAATEPGGNHGTGTVTAGTGRPGGYLWDKLAEAGADRKALDELLDELDAHGYARGGQLYTATLAAYNSTGGKRQRRLKEG